MGYCRCPPVLELSCGREFTWENSMVNIDNLGSKPQNPLFCGIQWCTSILKLICSRNTIVLSQRCPSCVRRKWSSDAWLKELYWNSKWGAKLILLERDLLNKRGTTLNYSIIQLKSKTIPIVLPKPLQLKPLILNTSVNPKQWYGVYEAN